MERIYHGEIKDNKLQLYQEDLYLLNIQAFDGQKIELILRKAKSKRSIQQNRYLWAIYKIIGEHTGYSSSEIHDLCKGMFLKKHIDIKAKGKILRYKAIGSTTRLSTAKFTEYIEQIKDWSAVTFENLQIPNPDDIYLEE